MRYLFLLTILLSKFYSYSISKMGYETERKIDTNYINQLNLEGYNYRLKDPKQTLLLSKKAKRLSENIKYLKGQAEANRIIGIGYYYNNQRDSSLNHYFLALNIANKINDMLIEAKTYNNIGNMWVELDNNKALKYFNQSLKLSKKIKNKDLIAGLYLNIGNVYYRKKDYLSALKRIEYSNKLFEELNNPIGITQSLQNSGVVNFHLKRIDIAEKKLLEAHSKAKVNMLNSTLSSMNMTLTSIYISKNNFAKAELFLNEGLAISKSLDDKRRVYDYIFIKYELEVKRKDFKKAIFHLKKVHDLDSIFFQKENELNINLIQQTLKQQQKENQLIIENEKYVKKLLIATAVVAVLSISVIFLLIKTNRKSKKSNLKLQALNEEVSKQKNNVERINHKLEEIITERTKDLIIKNQKLSQYSSHLSHQIRAPIATLKGLVMLIQDGLVESQDVTVQIKKCVDEIDNQIMNINDALHDQTRQNLD